jgi:hypothetical protein
MGWIASFDDHEAAPGVDLVKDAAAEGFGGLTMGDSTAVDTVALAAAGRSASARSHDVLGAVGASSTSMSRLAGELPGALSAEQVMAARLAVAGVLGELGQALGRLGQLLSAAATGYAQAEGWATQQMTPSGAPASSSASGTPASGTPASGTPASGPQSSGSGPVDSRVGRRE